jgi:hypothetical protein
MLKPAPENSSGSSLQSRRHLLASIAAAGIVSASGCSTPRLGRPVTTAQMNWIPEPLQPPTKEDFADIGDVRLWYSDTGGTNEPVVVLHPLTGSDAVWSYQRPAFVDAGFRFIAYSRRGHGKSEPGPPNDPGYGARVGKHSGAEAISPSWDRSRRIPGAGLRPVLSRSTTEPGHRVQLGRHHGQPVSSDNHAHHWPRLLPNALVISRAWAVLPGGMPGRCPSLGGVGTCLPFWSLDPAIALE